MIGYDCADESIKRHQPSLVWIRSNHQLLKVNQTATILITFIQKNQVINSLLITPVVGVKRLSKSTVLLPMIVALALEPEFIFRRTSAPCSI